MIRTGYVTTKGALVRDILYPKETKFKFYRDSLIFVGVMALVGIFGFIGTLPKLIELGTDDESLVDKSLDLITITVPPALPATMSVGVAFAIIRLKRSNIFCISPPRVNVSGMIQIMVFDKTGTLTEDGLTILGLRGVLEKGFSDFKASIKELLVGISSQSNRHQTVFLNEALACCHSITYVNQELMGDPLEIKMFEMTGWHLDETNYGGNSAIAGDDIIQAWVRPPKQESGNVGNELAIVKRFDFESRLQRMSVIVKNRSTNNYHAYVKGSPEMIATLCKDDTMPLGYDEILRDYTVRGYRVIALATKTLE